ncbi:helix-turn-helix domain-containing protein [Blautia sp. HCP28S3_G10]|uniref:helix-turn-helix domain-containing protein n=1 Tax=Blautia sp. HCP28S3_G10 TaxID=3438908 RepID=UPI003F8BC130
MEVPDCSSQMMEEENLSVKEAALAAGYQNLNHFYKYFNQYTGMTPAAYIKQRRQ